MVEREDLAVLTGRPLLPHEGRNEILFPEDLVTELAEIGCFTIVDADEDGPVTRKHLPRQHEARVHHVEPVRVEPS